MKRIISIMLTVVMLALIPAAAPVHAGAEKIISGDFAYELDNSGNAEIDKYSGSASNLTIPSSLDGHKVTKIDSWAFSGCKSVVSLTIPDTVTKFYIMAFSDMPNLKSVFIPKSVNDIWGSTFYRCPLLETITVDKDNRYYDSRENCNALIETKTNTLLSGGCKTRIPSSVTAIGATAFLGSSIKSITIPDSVKTIERSAFEHCESLTSITIPDSVETIGHEAFRECSSLKSVRIGNSVKTIEKLTFWECTSLTDITFGSSVSCINESVFFGCTSLSQLTFPESLVRVDESVFWLTPWLENQPDDGPVFAGKALYKYKGVCPEVYEIPEGTTCISGYAFSDQTKLRSVKIPDTVTFIGKRAFDDCTSLTDVTIPDSVTSVGTLAFGNCTSMKSVVIPASVTEISDSAFGYQWVSPHYVLLEDFTIYGSKDSMAESYAMTNDITFIEVGDMPPVSDKKPLSECDISLRKTTVYEEHKPTVVAYDDSTKMKEGTDYSVQYKNTDTIGTGTAIITGIGNYTGIVTLEFTIIEKIDISGYTAELTRTYYVYDGRAKEPDAIVTYGAQTLDSSAYFLTYESNVNPGTATAIIHGYGDYKGTITATFTIASNAKTKISDCSVTLSQTTYTYDGSEKTPSVTVKNGSKTLSRGSDYTVTYTDNRAIGNAKVTITGQGDYTGTVTKNFTITSVPKISLSSCTITLSQTTYTYDGGEKKPAVTVKYGSKTLSQGSDYTVAYTDNRTIGTAKVTITGQGDYTGNETRSFTITANKISPFEWGKDNWNFNNSSYQGYFPRSTYRNQISSSYLDTLKNNLTNSEYQCIFVNSAYHTAWLDESWGGSCYGMTSLTLLSKSGLFPYSSYKSGAAKLHDLNYPKNDSQVSSVVTYYQMLQVKNVIQQQYRSVPLRTNETNIKDIIAKLDDNPVVAIGFSKSGWGGHAILATGYEYGNWTWDDISYQGCIRICDPNCSMSYNSEYNIYFNTHTYNWTIPAYDVITSVNGAKFNFIGASVADINQGGYLSGTANRKIDGYIARIDAPAIASNRTVTKVVESNGAYMNNNAAPGEIIEDESYFVGGESQGITGYNLLDADASYRVSQQTPVELRLSMDYENCDLYGSSMAGRSVLFDKSGYVEVNGDSAKYQLGMTFDRDYPTDWFSIAATGYGADAASLRKASEGYVLSADHLEKITVTANNKSAEATAKIASAEDSVLLYEINKNTIGVRVDKDGNGIYETDLMILGDTDGNRTLDTVDATLVQRRSLGLETALTEEELLRGDTDGSKVLDITDVTAIQYATINLETTYPVGSFVM